MRAPPATGCICKAATASRRFSSFSPRAMQAAATTASAPSASVGAARGRVLVFGAAGTFGSRICSRLPDVQLAVAGRSRSKLDSLAAQLRRERRREVRPEVVDIGDAQGVAAVLKNFGPSVVINTCGPFGPDSMRLAEECIRAGTHYVDLADSREFVEGIGALDASARKAGVLVASGASSVPALSSAVIDSFLPVYSELHTIDHSISPGNRNERGLGTVQSVLSYCGGKIPQLRAGVWGETRGWGGWARESYLGATYRRWVADVDVPDLSLFPQRYGPSLRSVRFRAGLEFAPFSLGLALMSLCRERLGLPRDWSRYAPALRAASEWVRLWGTEEGCMRVALSGIGHKGEAQLSEWQLYGSEGDGPEVPCTAAVVLALKLLREESSKPWIATAGTLGRLPRGAMPCVGLVSLEEFLSSLAGYNITTFRFGAGALPPVISSPALPPNPYGAALGHWTAQLPAGLRRFHEEGGRAMGTLEVSRGSSVASRLLAALAQLPSPAAACPVEVTSQRLHSPRDANDAGTFRWHRLFQGRPLTSLVSFERGLQMERFGPWRFGFQVLPVLAEDGRRGLRHVTKRVWFLGMPLPRWIAPSADGTAMAPPDDADGWEVSVEVRMLLVGRVVRYVGRLRVL